MEEEEGVDMEMEKAEVEVAGLMEVGMVKARTVAMEEEVWDKS